MPAPDHDIIDCLRKEILRMEGFKQKPVSATAARSTLHGLMQSFPNHSFPTGAIHEFLCSTREQEAASAGFITALMQEYIPSNGAMVWISAARSIYPVALAGYGIDPERVLFIDVKKEKDVLWVMEESLKCDAISFVVAELDELGFAASRRLQLAVEYSGVTGFVLRRKITKLNTTACIARWKISSIHSVAAGEIPGIGHPCWQVELLRVRNGKPGSWKIFFMAGKLIITETATIQQSERIRKVV